MYTRFKHFGSEQDTEILKDTELTLLLFTKDCAILLEYTFASLLWKLRCR